MTDSHDEACAAGCQVADPKNPTKKREDRELVKFDGPMDSVYLNARNYVELDVGTGQSKLLLMLMLLLRRLTLLC